MIRFFCGVLVCLCAVKPAFASFHEWKIEEIFSSADGSVQYIELHTNVDGQEFLHFRELSSNNHTFIFPKDLLGEDTGGHSFIFATSDFEALPGSITPDYVFDMPGNFFSVHGDTISFAGVDFFTFSDGELPLDGRTALKKDRTTALNSPTNFAGAQGSVTIEDAPLPPWQNPALAVDIDDNGNVEALDVLVLVNAINSGLDELPVPPIAPLTPPPYYDPDGNGFLEALDVLIVVNFLNNQSPGFSLLKPMGLQAGPAAFAAPVPEPGSAVLAACALLALAIGVRPAHKQFGNRSLASPRVAARY